MKQQHNMPFDVKFIHYKTYTLVKIWIYVRYLHSVFPLIVKQLNLALLLNKNKDVFLLTLFLQHTVYAMLGNSFISSPFTAYSNRHK